MSDKPETYSDDSATEWYRRHRPRRFSDVLGQETVVKQLLRMVKTDSVPHAILFTGGSGTGKTTLARILQKKLLCSDRDFCEINAADTRGIDTVRDIRRAIGLAPVGGQSRIWLIDEMHKCTGDAQTALLKILEDAPKHAYFILATTDPQKVIKTIHTRCTTFKLESVGTAVLEQLVRDIATKEKVSPPLSDAVVTALAESAEGSPRKALVTLQEVCLLDKEEDRLNAIQPPEVKRIAYDLVRLLVWGKPSWEKVRTMLLEIKEDPEGLRRLIMANARVELLKPKGNYDRAAAILAEFGKPFYDCAPSQLAAACYEVFRGLE